MILVTLVFKKSARGFIGDDKGNDLIPLLDIESLFRSNAVEGL
jgi:hypothetical protein